LDSITTLLAGSEWRGYIYGLLGRIFYQEPGLSFLEDLAARDIFSWSFLPLKDDGAVEGVRLLTEYQESFKKGDIHKNLDELKWDYFRMFIGAGMPEAPPWESYYRTEEGIIFSEYTLAVRAQYERFGLVSENKGHEPEDHIGLELEFMSFLCDRWQELLRKGDGKQAAAVLNDQKTFMDEHLLPWVPIFCRKVVNAAEIPFFKGAARLTQAFLEWDNRFLREHDSLDQHLKI